MLRDAQPDLPDAPTAFLALRDPAANACLVWEPGQREPTAISPPGSDDSRVCGAYAIVLGERSHNGGKLFEDGFAIERRDDIYADVLPRSEPTPTTARDGDDLDHGRTSLQ